MRVTLKLYGNLRRYAADRKELGELEVATGASVGTLLEQLGIPGAQWWMAAVNDRVVEVGTSLNEGDVVEVFEPVGGGCEQPLC